MPLARMICASQTKFPVGQANDKTIFRAIHDESARHYAERQITGALLFDWDNFLQILEGDRARLTDAFLFMARDPRQQRIVLLDFSRIDEREFGRWQMLLRDDSPETAALLLRYSPTAHWKPEAMPPTAALKFAQALVQARESQAEPPLRAAHAAHAA